MSTASVRVRFAPSPTGLLHIGGLRTALYNYLLARQQGGTFILRIEDTDQERFVAAAEADILDALAWAGLSFDEGPGVGGAHVPYYQSQRSALYRRYAEQLIADGRAYYAFDTPDEIEAMRARLREAGNHTPKYDHATRAAMRNSLTLGDAEVQGLLDAGTPHVVRLKVEAGQTVTFTDAIRDAVSFETDELDDQVLLKSDGLPTYHLANVVDDHHMGITQVIRGEEWLPSTPKHVLLYEALGWTPPQFAHLPLILSPTGGKLSKRNAEKMGIPVSVRQYREAGYEPAALVNFLAFLGWNPGTEQELFTLDELVAAFSLDRVGSSGVQFSMDKLNWYNEQYLRRLTPEALAERAHDAVRAAGYDVDRAYLAQVAALMQERITFAHELATASPYFYEDPTEYDAKALKRWKADTNDHLAAFAEALDTLPTFDEASIEAALKAVLEAREIGMGKLMLPARLAVSGVGHGPSLYAIMALLGRATCRRRIQRALDTLPLPA